MFPFYTLPYFITYLVYQFFLKKKSYKHVTLHYLALFIAFII